MLPFVTTLVLAAHLLAMNVASAGPLVAAWLLWQDRGSGQVGAPWSVRLCRLSLAMLVVGSALGAGLLLLPNPAVRGVLARFPADAYWFAGLELVFSAACMLALIVGRDWFAKRRWLAAAVALASATNLLYHFPPLMAVIGELAADPRWASAEVLDRPALLQLWRRPEILSLWIHFVLASLAVAPIAALWQRARRDKELDDPNAEPIVRRLGAWALGATLLQLPVGLWLLAAADDSVRESMMGRDAAASLFFAGGLVAAMGLVQALVGIALGEGPRGVQRAGWLLVLVTVLMSATLRTSRTAGNPSESAPKLADAVPAADR